MLAFALTLPMLGCPSDDQPADDEVGEDTTSDTTTSEDETESSDTAETTDTTTEDTTETDTTETDTTESDTTDGPADADMDGVPADEDCDDGDPLNFPGNSEVCDGQDNDCDALIDNDPIDGTTYYGDMDGDGYGIDNPLVACSLPPGFTEVPGDCNDADPDAYPDANDVCALGPTCKAILDSMPASDDGVYLVDPAGVDVGGPPVDVWCDMTNGGLTAALVINSVNEGAYVGDFGADYVSTALLAADPALSSQMGATAVQAWLDLNEYGYDEFRLAIYSDGVNTFMSEAIARTSLRIEFGQDGYLLWDDPDHGYYWCGGAKAFTDDGIGQVNPPPGAPADCKGHTSLGSGWDFSLTGGAGPGQYNTGLTLCGGDPSTWMYRNYGNSMVFYPNAGSTYVVWTL